MHRPQFRCRLTTGDSLVAEPYAIAFWVSATSPRAVTSRADLSETERTTITLHPAASPSVARSNEPATDSPIAANCRVA